jgi:hypothetical protein
MIKHLPLILNRVLIRYNIYFLNGLCQSFRDPELLLLQLLTRTNDSSNDVGNYKNETGGSETIIMQTVLVFLPSSDTGSGG